MRLTRTTIGAVAGAFALTAMLVGPIATASAADTFQVSFDSVSNEFKPGAGKIRAPEGAVLNLATAAVPADLVGRECTASIDDINNNSVHPGNDIVVASGATSVRFAGVEDVAGETIGTGSNPVVLGASITVDLIMGPDEVFSASGMVTIECAELPPTTTSTTTSTTTTTAPVTPTTTPTTPSTSVSPTPTTVPPTTTTTQTRVAGVTQANPAVAQDAQPSFTG